MGKEMDQRSLRLRILEMIKIAIVTALTLVFSICHAAGDEIVYFNLFSKGAGANFGIWADQVRIGDLLVPAQRCAPSDKYECIISKPFIFAVPRGNKVMTEWKRDGAHYKVLMKEEALIFGEIVEYRLIRQVWKGDIVDYAFSDDYGVIAIKAGNGNQLWLGGKCGFAALTNTHGCRVP